MNSVNWHRAYLSAGLASRQRGVCATLTASRCGSYPRRGNVVIVTKLAHLTNDRRRLLAVGFGVYLTGFQFGVTQ